jgi:hypothetical protein
MQARDWKTNPLLGLSALLTSTPQKGRQISPVCASKDSANILTPALESFAISQSFQAVRRYGFVANAVADPK